MSDDDDDRAFALTPHDALFRRALEHIDDARSAIRAALPEPLAEGIDWSQLAPATARFTTTELRERESDLVFTAPFDGVELLLRLLLEHQSAIDWDMALRVARGQSNTWDGARDRDALVLPVIPIVVHHGPSTWCAPLSMLDRLDVPDVARARFAAFTPASRYFVDDLAGFDARGLARRTELTHVVRIAYFLLQRTRGTEALGSEIGLFRRDLALLAEDERGLRFLASVVRYILYVGKGDERTVLRALRNAVGRRSTEDVMGEIAERLKEQGRLEGRRLGEAVGEARGEARGELLGRVKTLKRQLELKFGPLTDDTLEAIARASSDDLDRMIDAVLTATTLDDALDV